MLSTGKFANPSIQWYHWGPDQGWDLIAAALGTMVVAGVLAVLVAIPTLRLRADYLAIATLALAEIVRLVLKNERSFTGGDQDLSFIPRPFQSFVPLGPYSDGLFMAVAVGGGLLVLVFLDHLARAPLGPDPPSVPGAGGVGLALGAGLVTS